MANILGINLSPLSAVRIEDTLRGWLAGNSQHQIVTPNPEIILAAHRDEELFYILNRADLAPADGFGLRLAGWLYGENIPRVTGADLVVRLLNLARENKRRIAVLNWRGGLSKKNDIIRMLDEDYAGLEHTVIDASRTASVPNLSSDTAAKLAAFSPDILFCTFGAPFQEKAIYHNLSRLPSVRIAIGCGGAFDFLTGKLARAPRLLRFLGLEWLWRLSKQPSRWRRIYNAVIVFTAKVIQAKFITRYRYRPNVACLLFRNTASGRKILLVERCDQPGHWQLPQGGTDGEDIETAGRRELREETGASSVVSKGIFRDLYRYDFPGITGDPESREHKYDYRGQKQSLYIAEFAGTDEEINVNFWDHSAWRWVDEYRLAEELHPIRRPAGLIYLEKLKSIK